MRKASTAIIAVLTLAAVLLLPATPYARMLFEDRFSDNRNGWAMGGDEDVNYRIEHGRYVFDVMSESNWYYSTRQVAIDQKGDFSIECNTSKVSGIEDYGYGLVWGLKDNANFQFFALFGSGGYRYEKVVKGAWTTVIDYTESAVVNRSNAANRIRIRKKGDTLGFYVNNVYLNEAPFSRLQGDWVGFVVFRKKKVLFDDLIITQGTTDSLDHAKENEPVRGRIYKIAVVEFVQRGGLDAKDAGSIIAEWMTTALTRTGAFQVYERLSLDKIVEEHRLGKTGIIDDETMAEIGKMRGVEAVVTGSVLKFGNTVSVTSKLIDTESARIIDGADLKVTTIEDIPDRIDDLAMELAID